MRATHSCNCSCMLHAVPPHTKVAALRRGCLLRCLPGETPLRIRTALPSACCFAQLRCCVLDLCQSCMEEHKDESHFRAVQGEGGTRWNVLFLPGAPLDSTSSSVNCLATEIGSPARLSFAGGFRWDRPFPTHFLRGLADFFQISFKPVRPGPQQHLRFGRISHFSSHSESYATYAVLWAVGDGQKKSTKVALAVDVADLRSGYFLAVIQNSSEAARNTVIPVEGDLQNPPDRDRLPTSSLSPLYRVARVLPST